MAHRERDGFVADRVREQPQKILFNTPVEVFMKWVSGLAPRQKNSVVGMAVPKGERTLF